MRSKKQQNNKSSEFSDIKKEGWGKQGRFLKVRISAQELNGRGQELENTGSDVFMARFKKMDGQKIHL